jgi:hypothetical protein
MTTVIGGAPDRQYSRRVHRHSCPPAPAAVPGRIFVPFFIASLTLSLTWGATLGMINLARLTTNWGLGTLPRPSVWAHAYVQVFGFMALFVMGVACHVLPRFVGGTLQTARLVRWTFGLQLAGVVAIAYGFFHDAPLTRPLWIAGSTALVLASALFRTVVVRTIASGMPGHEPFRRWVSAGAGWLVISAAIALTAAITGDVAWHRVLWTAALAGFTSSWIFGVGSRIFPIFVGCVPRWPQRQRTIFAMYQAGVVLWTIGAWPAPRSSILDAAQFAGGFVLLASVTLITASLGIFARRRPVAGDMPRSPHDGWQRHVLAAFGWLFASLVLGAGWTMARLIWGFNDSLLVLDMSRHALAFGFATQMVLGVASRVVPNFTGKPLWSVKVRDAAFYLLNASLLVRALELPIGFGFWVGAWSSIAWSGPLGVAAMALFTLNIIMTVRQQPSVVAQPVIPAAALQPRST